MLMVLNKDDRTVMMVNAGDHEIVASLTVDRNPHEAILTPDGQVAYVSNAGGNTISVIHVANRHEITRLSDPDWRFPHGLEVTPDGRYLWMASTYAHTVWVIARDPDNHEHHETVKVIPTGQKSSHMVHFSPDANVAYVPNIGSNTLTVLDVRAMEIIRHVDVGPGPEGVAVHPVDGTIYVANQGDDTLMIIDPASFEVRHTLKIGAVPVRATFTPDGEYCLIANRLSDEISVIAHNWSLATAEPQPWEIKRIQVGRWPGQIVVHPTERRAWVTNNKTNDVSEINLGSMTETARIPVGIHPDGMIWVGTGS